MARSNRVSVPGGTYYVTTGTVNGERWFADPEFKDRIAGWIRGVAAFSGVELPAWSVLDDGLELVVRVPEVPERYRTDPESPPASYAFGMRPPERRTPLWASGNGPQGPARPPTGFTVPDGEMLGRLLALHGDRPRVEGVRRRWAELRAAGRGAEVEAAKARLCRRMYNLSQFVKTLKERIAAEVGRRTGRTGPVFAGRFHSALVQDEAWSLRLVTLHVDHAPHRGAGDASGPCRWSSLGEAEGDSPRAGARRAAYERIWGRPWPETWERIRAALAERPPEDPSTVVRVRMGEMRIAPGRLAQMDVPELARGAYIGRDASFVEEAVDAVLPPGFPRPSVRALQRLVRMVEWPHAA